MEEKKEITAIACGPSNRSCKCDCPDSCEHVWDGKPVDLENGGWSVTCSRCRMAAIDHDMWVMP